MHFSEEERLMGQSSCFAVKVCDFISSKIPTQQIFSQGLANHLGEEKFRLDAEVVLLFVQQ
jgi:hypothetical protein